MTPPAIGWASGTPDSAGLIYFAAVFGRAEVLPSDWLCELARLLGSLVRSGVGIPVNRAESRCLAPVGLDQLDLALHTAHVRARRRDLRGSAGASQTRPDPGRPDRQTAVGAAGVLRCKFAGPVVVAGVNGTAGGAGLGSALACDARLSKRSARFIGAFGPLGSPRHRHLLPAASDRRALTRPTSAVRPALGRVPRLAVVRTRAHRLQRGHRAAPGRRGGEPDGVGREPAVAEGLRSFS